MEFLVSRVQIVPVKLVVWLKLDNLNTNIGYGLVVEDIPD